MTTTPDRDDRHIDPGADRCPECGGYGQRGCGAAWHDGKPDTHCSPACQCSADIKADLRYWHQQALTQQARAETAETEAADARLDAEGWERTARAAEAREADLLERGDHRGAVLSLRQQRDRLAARVETLEGALAPFGLAPGNFLTYTHGDGTTCEVAQIVCAPVMEALRALVAPDPNPTDDMCPRCNRKLADHDLAAVAAACPDPTEAESDRCPCEHRWVDHGTAGCGFSYCACVRPNPTDTGDPT